jgi:hypothetical protein
MAGSRPAAGRDPAKGSGQSRVPSREVRKLNPRGTPSPLQ